MKTIGPDVAAFFTDVVGFFTVVVFLTGALVCAFKVSAQSGTISVIKVFFICFIVVVERYKLYKKISTFFEVLILILDSSWSERRRNFNVLRNALQQ
ncbi:hypothetical protein D3C87_1915460 [compost metagenome]